MPLQATSGAASYDAFGGGVPVVPNYIEDVFSTYLYTGNGSSQTITNGIDLSGKGGLVWFKRRSTAISHALFDSARSSTSNALFTNTTGAQVSSYGVTFNSNGVSLGQSEPEHNSNGETYVSWTFRKQPKFFDVVTYTGNGSSKTINHNLGSVPGVMIVKSTTYVDNWAVYHRSLGATKYIELNNTDAASTSVGSRWDAEPTSTSFSVGYNGSVNASGQTYVAYLFAHDAGGFGLSGTDNVISCGSFTASMGSLVNIGFEPQFVLIKRTDTSSVDDWLLFDNMRGLTMGDDSLLNPNTSGAENNSSGNNYLNPQPTGFTQIGFGSGTFIYIAIRRGPMKVPTDGTSVFNPDYAWNTNPNILGYLGQPTDAFWLGYLSGNAVSVNTRTRLVGGNRLTTSSTSAEVVDATTTYWSSQLGFQTGGSLTTSLITWNFRRAPGFFDVVCYLGTGSATTVAHNLGAVPELMIVKERNGANGWQVYSASLTNTDYLILNTSAAVPSPSTTRWNSTTPTSTVFSVGTHGATNGSGQNFVAYLFATCAGVSKVGSYTGTGTTKQIDCGFTGGARFVLIKRTDSTGSWYVWDSSRGIVSGNDPYLLLNSTAAEVTNTDYIDTYSAGFEISSTAPAEINASGGSFIFLAVA